MRLKLYLISIGIKKFEFGEMVAGIRSNGNLLSEFAFPFRHLTVPEETFG